MDGAAICFWRLCGVCHELCLPKGDSYIQHGTRIHSASLSSQSRPVCHPMLQGLDERVIAPIMLQVLKALEYLHKHGIVHRDVKVGLFDCSTFTLTSCIAFSFN